MEMLEDQRENIKEQLTKKPIAQSLFIIEQSVFSFVRASVENMKTIQTIKRIRFTFFIYFFGQIIDTILLRKRYH